jgi:hypothetical protein
MFAHVYSSESAAWDNVTTGPPPGALAQNAIYFVLSPVYGMVKYDVAPAGQAVSGRSTIYDLFLALDNYGGRWAGICRSGLAVYSQAPVHGDWSRRKMGAKQSYRPQRS